LACDRQKLFFIALQLCREPDIVRRFLQEVRELLAPFDERSLCQIGFIQKEQIEGRNKPGEGVVCRIRKLAEAGKKTCPSDLQGFLGNRQYYLSDSAETF
jgi:hypothetical protein